MFSVAGLSYTYPGRDRPSLHEVSFEVGQGETLQVVGPNGTGKTTLLRVLCGLVPHHHGGRLSGSVQIAGRPLRELPPVRMARHVAYASNTPHLQLLEPTIEDEVARFPAGWHRDHLIDLLKGSHLFDRLHDPPAILSGGQQHLLNLLLSLGAGRKGLLWDEPFIQLDSGNQAVMRAALRDHLKASGTVVISTPDEPGVQVDRIVELAVLSYTSRIAPLPPPTGGTLLKVNDLALGFGSIRVISDLSFEVAAGELLALEGPNGSGKTTLLRAIAGFQKLEAGSIEVLGSRERDPRRLAPRVAYLPQEPGRFLFTDSVSAEIGFSVTSFPGHTVKGRIRAHGLRGIVADDPRRLSGGQRARVAIAATCLPNRRIWLLDEPARSLDRVAFRRLVEALRDHLARGGAAIVAAHAEPILDLAHRHLVLRGDG